MRESAHDGAPEPACILEAAVTNGLVDDQRESALD
jgi:hypothetical protein